MGGYRVMIVDDRVRLIHGDAAKFLNIDSVGTVDAIITDPPYNISRDNNFNTMGRTGIDFGRWDREFNVSTWIGGMTHVVKKGGNVVIFCDWKSTTPIVGALEGSGFDVKDLLRWEKTNPMPRNRDRRFVCDFEVAIWAVRRGGKWVFNRISDTYERPKMVYGITKASEKVHGGHPTQKPVDVMKWIVERLTAPGDRVLDPYMGSGTTGVACLELGRDFVGIERDRVYFEVATKRIKSCREGM